MHLAYVQINNLLNKKNNLASDHRSKVASIYIKYNSTQILSPLPVSSLLPHYLLQSPGSHVGYSVQPTSDPECETLYHRLPQKSSRVLTRSSFPHDKTVLPGSLAVD